jgi:hypothetical protein
MGVAMTIRSRFRHFPSPTITSLLVSKADHRQKKKNGGNHLSDLHMT